MADPPRSPFDRYAPAYRELHASAVRASGEEPEYFAQVKVDYIARAVACSRAGFPAHILDFGCGIGGGVGSLRQAFPRARLTGIDTSKDSIAIARAEHPDAHFDTSQDSGLPLPDASIDIAMAACVFHHILPFERLFWTRELRRVLRPGGQLFIFEHNPLNPVTRKVVRDCVFDADAVLLGRSEIRQLLRASGFADLKNDYLVFFPRVLAFLRPLEARLGWLPAGAQCVVSGSAT